MGWHSSARKIYQGLLWAYPTEFRHEYGEQMEQLFALRLSQESNLRLWLETLADLALTAPQEHLHILRNDLRQATRLLCQTPGFTFAALLALTLGIGTTTTVFSLFNAVLLRSLPYGDPAQLVYLWTPLPTIQQMPQEVAPSWADVADWRRLSSSFLNITALQMHKAVLQDRSATRVMSARVLGNFFQTLQATPELGRGLSGADDRPGQPLVAVISDALWRSHFGSDPAVLGRSLRMDGREYRVVGVMPAEFSFPHGTDLPLGSPWIQRTEIWIPATLNQQQQSDRVSLTDEPDLAIGRLRPTASLRQAQAEMSAIEARLAPLYTGEWRSVTSLLTPFLQTALGSVRPLLRLMMAAVFLVLLIACANFTNLLLVRSSERAHEMGIRLALGAERIRLLRQLLTESLLFSIFGGGFGVLFSFVALRFVTRLNPGDIPRLEESSLDGHVLLFGLGVALCAGVGAGLYPALVGSSVQVTELLRQGGRGIAGVSSRARSLLIVVEVALAVVLLACGGLLLRSYWMVQAQDKGFAPSTVTMSFTAAEESDPPPIAARDLQAWEKRRIALNERLVTRVRSLPGVVAAGWIDDLPLSHSEDIDMLQLEGQSESARHATNVRHVSARYFEAMLIRLFAGRFFREADIENNPEALPAAVIVSESFAQAYFPGQSAVGHRLRFRKERWSTIVGVVGDVRHSSLEQTPQPTVYWPYSFGGTLAVRAATPADRVVAAIRNEASRLNPGSAITDVKTMAGYIAEANARRQFQTVMLTVFSAIAVFLALVGLYGLLSYGVRQRTAEIGVRIAVGASRQAVLLLILRYGLTLTVTGIALGLLLAFAATHTLSSLLYGVKPTDPITFVVVPALLLVVATLACFNPAWKAARVDPVQALRHS